MHPSERPAHDEPRGETLVSLLRWRARAQPDALAYAFLGPTPGAPSLTYGELDRRARAVGRRLQSLAAAGERALLLFPPGLEFIEAFFGCLYAGAIAVPAAAPSEAGPRRSLPRLANVARDARAAFVLTTRSLEQRLAPDAAELGARHWVAIEGVTNEGADLWQAPPVTAESLAFLQYTSGSTGSPKGVMVSHGNVLHNSADIRQGFGHSGASVGVCWLPSFHDMGLIDGIIQPLYSGFPCHLMSPVAFIQHPLAWLEAVARLRATHSGGPNFAYDLCVRRTQPAERAALDLSSWAVAYSGAEPVRVETLERFAEAFAVAGFRARALYPCYGLAEATLKVSGGQRGQGPVIRQVRAPELERHRVVLAAEAPQASGPARTLVGCGRVSGGVEVAVVHPETGRRCAPDGVGEIWIAGPSVAQGYWGKPDETERTFRARVADAPGDGRYFLRTGDLGFLHEGELFVTGRRKDLIIVDGRNHYPQDLEQTARASDPRLGASTCVAFGVERDGVERAVVAIEVGRHELRRLGLPAVPEAPGVPGAGSPETLGQALARAVRRAVAEQHDLPVDRVLLLRPGAVPKTSSGKVQRRQCRDRLLAGEIEPLFDDLSAGPKAEGADATAGGDSAGRPSARAIGDWLASRLGVLLGGAPVERSRPLAELGLGSRDLVSLSGELSAWLGRPLAATLFWEHPSVESVARHLAGEPGRRKAPDAPAALAVPAPAEGADAPAAPATSEPIAVVGLGCRFPGAAGPDAFWELLRKGERAIAEIPPERWAAAAHFDPDPEAPGKMVTRWGGFLDRIDGFDAHFFGISPREANEMDPQQRLLLEVAWAALEHAGIAPDALAGSRTGVFLGISTSDYGQLRAGALERIGPYSGTGGMASVAAGRLSYLLGLQGPSLVVDTACSSSLVALHLACRSLAERECDLALVGAANALLWPGAMVALSKLRAMSPTGRCRPFDAGADGYVRGEGCGVVVLKRRSDAEAANDRILALVRGTAINSDGRSNGLTAPNGLAQEAVIRQALARAGVRPAEVGYVEAHGTGTPLGDPIEVQALARVLAEGRPPGERAVLGSVKANIGHLEAAAGVAGLIKVVLALAHAEVPPQPDFERPNPLIAWASMPLAVAAERAAWREPGGRPTRRIAGISSFGFSGTNAHAVLEAPPDPPPIAAAHPRPWHLLCLSARTESALAALARSFERAVAGAGPEQLADICFTAHTGRAHFEHRLAVVVETADAAAEALAAAASGRPSRAALRARVTRGRAPKVAFLFTGQGALEAGAGRALYEGDETFRGALERCDRLLRPWWGRPLRDVLYPEPGAPDLLAEARYAQPALFALQYALVELWQSWGIEPAAALGHSLGEYAAAWATGVLSLADALALVVERARLMQALPAGGAMAVVLADESRVAPVLEAHAGRLALAAYNAPEVVVLSGEGPALGAALAALEAEGVKAQRLPVTHAFHSPLMNPVLAPFERFCATLAPKAPERPMVTCLTGALLDADAPPGPGHWARQLREPVRFSAGVRTLRELGCDAFLEVGPKPALLPLGRRCEPDPTVAWLPSLPPSPGGQADWQAFFGSLAALYTRGANVTWRRGEAHPARRRVALPTYPFEHKRHWFDDPEKETRAMPTEQPSSSKPTIVASLRGLLAQLLQTEAELIDEHTPLLELGADSISMLHAIKAVEERFGVRLSVRQLFEELTTLDAVADHLARATPARVEPPPVPRVESPVPRVEPPPSPSTNGAAASAGPNGASRPATAPAAAPAPQTPAAFAPPPPAAAAPAPQVGVAQALTQQLAATLATAGAQAPSAAASLVDQLVSQLAEALRAQLLAAVAASAGGPAPAADSAPAEAPPSPAPVASLAERQQAHLAALIERYTRRTQGSKHYARTYRPILSDLRSVVGFRPSIKEMVYPIVKGRSRGSRLWDIDGNEYVDITLGFGVHLFGHASPIITEAARRQLEEGIELGPRSNHAGPVAALIAELTGLERVAFCASGTEAVALAIRLARAATGRQRVVMFTGAYHGHGDATLAQPAEGGPGGGPPRAEPATVGIPQGAVDDVLVLPYGEPQSLETIAAQADELAAVLVEPVQSRYPALQPAEFLRELRALTERSGAALIFDEMITGFRVHLGGAQAWFGVRADIATYGKIIGGGLPIGVVAGRASFLDRLDGGAWTYGDDSRPRADHTYFASTFAMHPLTMATARAVLEHLKASGPGLQEELNRRTEWLATTLNDLFRREGAPIEVVRFGSLFRFEFRGNRDPLFFHLIEKGVYTWEGRGCFLSTAHTDEDLHHIVKAVEESVHEMQAGGFLPDPPPRPATRGVVPGSPAGFDQRAPTGEPGAQGRALAPWPRRRVAEAGANGGAPRPAARPRGRPVDFSLYFFGNYDAAFHEDKYRLLLEGARFADEHGFRAVWLPERHFHSFGGLSPNPSVLAAALAVQTKRVHVRAGSVVVPLHHPVRIAEEWSVVDNLSKGRVGLSIASGWHANDFVLAPEAFAGRRERMLEGIEQVRTLWRKGSLELPGPDGKRVEVALVPRPLQAELPLWIAVVNNPETYRLAGQLGLGVLTSLMTQTPRELAGNLALYRAALAEHGHPADQGHVTLLLHAHLGVDLEATRRHARGPFLDYLRSSVGLFNTLGQSQGIKVGFDEARPEDLEYLYDVAYKRYVNEAALIGTPESCAPVVEALSDMGVDELSCLVDFGLPADDVLASLPHLAALRRKSQATARPTATNPPDASPPRRLPLTEAQRQLWTLAQLSHAGSTAYNLVSALELRGPVRADALDRSLQQLAARHEALRTVIVPGGEQQEVRPSARIRLDADDLSGLPEPARASEASRLLAEESERPFDLSEGPLLRARLVRLEAERHLLVLAAHHIIVDGWSLGILGHELWALYAAARRGGDAGLAPTLQFREWAAWQDEHARAEQFRASEAFWLRQLATPTPDLALPSDRPRPAAPRMRGAQQADELSPELVATLKAFSRRHGCTPFMTLCAAFLALLHRLSGQKELVLGCPASGRPLEAHASLVGYCTHLLPIYSQCSGEETFADFLRVVRRRLLDAYEHQDYPFARLIERARASHDPFKAPLVRAVFNVDRPLALPPLDDLEASFRPVPARHTQFDLFLNVLEEGGSMVLYCDYDRDLFDAPTVARLLAQWKTLLAGALAEPTLCVAGLPLLSAEEKRTLLVEWNQTAAPFSNEACIHHLFEAWAERTPEAPALSFRGAGGGAEAAGQRLTYAEANRRANRLAWALRARGVGPEVLVGVCVERSLDMVIAILATLKAGGAYLPLDPDYPAGRLSFMAQDARPRLIVLGGRSAPLPASWGGVECLRLEDLDDEVSRQPARNPDPNASASNLAYVIYTSGSTGTPKGVAVAHRGACNFVAALAPALAAAPGTRHLQFASPSFDFSVHEMLMALCSGATLCVADAAARQLGDPLLALLDAERITHISLTPSVLATIAPRGLGHVKVITVAGEACPPELVARFGPGRRMFNLYGPTETTVWATFAECADDGLRPGIGRPLANLRVYVLDDRLEPVPIGVPGELYVGGVGVARGYLHRPGLSAERFVPAPHGLEPGERWYKTGDLARWRADGTLDYLGRRDHQVKVRGVRVELGEIESQLARQPGVSEAAVALREGPAPAKEPHLVAYVVPRAGAVVSPDELRHGLAAMLPPAMLPATFLVLSALPRSPNGKLDRRALPEPPAARAPEFAPAAARTPTERRLVELWSAAFGKASVGVHEGFLDLGGHSLLAVRLAAQIEAAFGQKLSPSLLLEAGTIAELARRLDASTPSAEPTCAVRLYAGDAGGGARPLFLVHPIGGHVLCYADLARALGGSRTVYGLRALGLEEAVPPLESVEAMAVRYLQEMRKLQPAGPYLLGGWSFGGLVALEMAQRLRAVGDAVPLLALIDSPLRAPEANLASFDDRALLEHFLDDLKGLPQGLTPDELAHWKALLEEARRGGSSSHRAGLADLSGHFKVFRANATAYQRYQPRPYEGRVVLIQAAHSGEDLAGRWRNLVTGPFETHVLPGDHYSLLRDGAPALAARLRQALAGYDRPKALPFSTLSNGLLLIPPVLERSFANTAPARRHRTRSMPCRVPANWAQRATFGRTSQATSRHTSIVAARSPRTSG